MDPFIGQLMLVSFGYAPKGWAICSGQLLAINQNQALFALLGTAYGGDGRVTFALPNLNGRAAMSSGQGPGLPVYTLGQISGSENVTLSVTQIPQHNHLISAAKAVETSSTPVANLFAEVTNQPGLNAYTSAVGPAVLLHVNAVSNSGGSLAHPNQSPFLVMNWIIALTGIFPSRN